MVSPQLHVIIAGKYDRCVSRVIRTLRRWPKEMIPFEADGQVKDCWQVIIVYQRSQEPVDWEMWEDAIRSCCEGVVKAMSRDDQGLLWLETDACIDYEGDDIPYGDPVQEAVSDELYDRVITQALDCRISKKLEAYIEHLLDYD